MQADGASAHDIATMEARLDATRKTLKIAGGGTQRKLHFEMLDADKKVSSLGAAVEKAELDVEEAELGVLAAIDLRDRAVAALHAEQGKLRNAKAHHAHLTLQAAAEANADSARYTAMYDAVVELQGMLGTIGGMEQAVGGLAEVASFLHAFLPFQYSIEQDPMLQGPFSSSGGDGGIDGKEDVMDNEGQEAFKVMDAVAQAQADLDDLRKQANEAAAQAVCDAAARAVAVVTGGSAVETPSPTASMQPFAGRIKEAEAKLEAAKRIKEEEAMRSCVSSSSSAAPAIAPTSLSPSAPSASPAAAAITIVEVDDVNAARSEATNEGLPVALRSAEQVAALPTPPETSRLPAAFTVAAAARQSAYRMHRSRSEGRFPPAQGGPRGRARSTDATAGSSRKRSRSAPGDADVEVLDDKGDQIMGSGRATKHQGEASSKAVDTV
jgi:hypothetical protein